MTGHAGPIAFSGSPGSLDPKDVRGRRNQQMAATDDWIGDALEVSPDGRVELSISLGQPFDIRTDGKLRFVVDNRYVRVRDGRLEVDIEAFAGLGLRVREGRLAMEPLKTSTLTPGSTLADVENKLNTVINFLSQPNTT